MNSAPTSSGQSSGAVPFTFRRRYGRIDWRKLAAVDVDRVARELDVTALQENVFNVAFCNIEAEDFAGADPHFLKLFRLSQLIIEYLMHTQQHLNGQIAQLQQSLQTSSEEVQALQKVLEDNSQDLKVVKKENRKRRKVIEAYQEMMNAGATGVHACPVCRREFMSADFLQSHIDRRHPDHSSSKVNPSVSSEEIQSRVLSQVEERLKATELHLREEMALRERKVIESKENELEEWKQRERARVDEEVERVRRPLVEQLERLQKEKSSTEETLQEQQAALAAANLALSQTRADIDAAERKSKEVSETSSGQVRHSQEEVETLKATLQEQVAALKAEQKRKSRSWKKEMEQMRETYERQLSQSQQEMQAMEQSLHSTWAEGKKEGEGQIAASVRSLQHRVKEQEEVINSQQKRIRKLGSSTRAHSLPPPAAVAPPPSAAVAPPPPAAVAPPPPAAVAPPPLAKVQPVEEPVAEPSTDEESIESETQDEDVDLGHSKERHSPTPATSSLFVPYPQWPAVKTHYSHPPEVVQGVRNKINNVLQDALVQRGIAKTATGLSTPQYDEKMGVLLEQRPKWREVYRNFSQHRVRLETQLEDILRTSYQPPTLKTKTRRRRRRASEEEEDVFDSSSIPPTSPSPPQTAHGSRPTGRPPRSPLPGEGSSPQHSPATPPPQSPPHSSGHGGGAMKVAYRPSVPPLQPKVGHKAPVQLAPSTQGGLPDSDESDTEETSGTVTESEEEEVEELTIPQTRETSLVPAMLGGPPTNPVKVSGAPPTYPVKVSGAPPTDRPPKQVASQTTAPHPAAKPVPSNTARKDNSWDSSSDDEIEHLATQTLTGTGRASSTPIKVAEPGRVHQLAASLSFEANPLARPPGGVPILGPLEGGISVIKPLYPSDHEDISDTESSIHVSELGPKGSNGSSQTMDNKANSLATRTLTFSGQGSALTTVTPFTVEDLTDSDFDM